MRGGVIVRHGRTRLKRRWSVGCFTCGYESERYADCLHPEAILRLHDLACPRHAPDAPHEG